jgi:uncharacterized membrane protein
MTLYHVSALTSLIAGAVVALRFRTPPHSAWGAVAVLIGLLIGGGCFYLLHKISDSFAEKVHDKRLADALFLVAMVGAPFLTWWLCVGLVRLISRYVAA